MPKFAFLTGTILIVYHADILIYDTSGKLEVKGGKR